MCMHVPGALNITAFVATDKTKQESIHQIIIGHIT